MNLIQQLEAEQIEKLTAKRAIPEFRPGDTLKVGVRVVTTCFVRGVSHWIRGCMSASDFFGFDSRYFGRPGER